MQNSTLLHYGWAAVSGIPLGGVFLVIQASGENPVLIAAATPFPFPAGASHPPAWLPRRCHVGSPFGRKFALGMGTVQTMANRRVRVDSGMGWTALGWAVVWFRFQRSQAAEIVLPELVSPGSFLTVMDRRHSPRLPRRNTETCAEMRFFAVSSG